MSIYKIKLANVMGMDINNAQSGVGILDALDGILDQEAFINYCRDQREGIEYANRIEKLDILATRYKKIQIDIQLEKQYDAGERFSKALAGKVKECRNYIEDKNTVFSKIVVDGEKYFTQKELTALQNIGSISVIIEYSKIHRLAGEIYKFYVIKSKQALLPQKKKPLISLPVKRF